MTLQMAFIPRPLIPRSKRSTDTSKLLTISPRRPLPFRPPVAALLLVHTVQEESLRLHRLWAPRRAGIPTLRVGCTVGMCPTTRTRTVPPPATLRPHRRRTRPSRPASLHWAGRAPISPRMHPPPLVPPQHLRLFRPTCMRPHQRLRAYMHPRSHRSPLRRRAWVGFSTPALCAPRRPGDHPPRLVRSPPAAATEQRLLPRQTASACWETRAWRAAATCCRDWVRRVRTMM
jgi:hypothetical protein